MGDDTGPDGPGADQAGLGTFVGRVRGHLSADDHEWAERTSDAVEDLRAELVGAADRLSAVARSLDPDVIGGPFSDPTDDRTAWEQLVAWADGVNADLVEWAARNCETPRADDRAADIGRLIQSARGEQLVDELLMAGVLVAPPGTAGSIAFADHRAWDIEFLTSSGATIARADVVITADAEELLHRVATRPGVDLIYTTTDAADGLQQMDEPGVAIVRPGASWPPGAPRLVVVDLGTDLGSLHAELSAAVGAPATGSVDALLEAVPVLALLVVGARAAARAAGTTDAGADVAGEAWSGTRDVLTSAGVSGLVGWASGMNLIKVPATLTFSLGRSVVRDARSDVELSARRVARARQLMADLKPVDEAVEAGTEAPNGEAS